MPTFSNRLPKESAHKGFDLRRTPQTGILTAIITSAELLACDTHYWQGRTTPCERIINAEGKTTDDSLCPACLRKQPWRSHCYVAAFAAKTAEHFLYECTTAAAKPLEEYQLANGTLRGCVINAHRPKQTPNGKVVIVTSAANLTRVNLPAAPDVIAALSVIWRLPGAALLTSQDHFPDLHDADGHAVNVSTIHNDADTLRSMHTPPDDAESEATFIARRDELTKALTKSNGHKKEPAKA